MISGSVYIDGRRYDIKFCLSSYGNGCIISCNGYDIEYSCSVEVRDDIIDLYCFVMGVFRCAIGYGRSNGNRKRCIEWCMNVFGDDCISDKSRYDRIIMALGSEIEKKRNGCLI